MTTILDPTDERVLRVRHHARAPNGSVWLVVAEPFVDGAGRTAGLYVLTPEALAATE